MSINGVLTIANSGLADISRGLSVISQNISNASTPGYATETTSERALTAGGLGMGVVTGPTQRQIDTQMQGDLFLQNATVSGLSTTTTALTAIDTVQGQPGGGSDLASLVGNLQDAFSTLQGSPDNQTQQSQVVSAALQLTQQVNALSDAYTTQRQTAQTDIVSGVQSLNAALATIGSLSTQIMQLQAGGQSTADLENQRDAAMQSVSQLISVKFLEQPNGDMLVQTPSGLSLPIHGTTAPLSTSAANLAPAASYPATVPGVMLDGVDVTRQLQGGSIGAAITLRDQTLPTYQGELDEFAQTLSTRFAGQGLTLFTDQNGQVPAGGGTPAQSTYVGYSANITVNPAVVADPSLVRDGTNTIAGSATGASAFTPNPAGGPAGFTTLIQRVLSYSLGSDAQSGVIQPAPATAGLGPTGTLTAPYATPADLVAFATAVVGAQAADSAQATTEATTEQAVQTGLQSQMSATSGVNMDRQVSLMIQLENAYDANAKIVSVAQQMFQTVNQMVQ